jgi:hypothetical protein
MKEIQIAAGTVRGTEHVRTGRNNQDAFHFAQTEDLVIGLVCDGCGSGAHTEVGANMGSRMVVKNLTDSLHPKTCNELTPSDVTTILENVRLSVTSQIRTLAEAMNTTDPIVSIITDYFLFTCVGFFLTRKQCVAFYLGDGICSLNGKVTRFEPMHGNFPAYLAYNAVDHRTFQIPEEALHFNIHKILPISELESLLVGTDGVQTLLHLEETLVPGTEEPIGPLSQFWQNNPFFKNPDMVRRRLAVINGEQRPGRIGPLLDDTTLIVARKLNA